MPPEPRGSAGVAPLPSRIQVEPKPAIIVPCMHELAKSELPMLRIHFVRASALPLESAGGESTARIANMPSSTRNSIEQC